QRFQSMHDVGFYLETLSGTSTNTIASPALVPRSSLKAVLPWIIVGLLFIIAGSGWFFAARNKVSSTENGVMRFTIPLAGTQRSVFNSYGALAISPDGHSIIYMGVDDQLRLYVRNLDSSESRPIPGTEGGRSPFFSPDGKWLGFLTEHYLKKVQLS